jgi:hypothetical protein
LNVPLSHPSTAVYAVSQLGEIEAAIINRLYSCGDSQYVPCIRFFSSWIAVSSTKTPRGTLLSVPPECCLLGCSFRYFFFAAFFVVFFAAFFAGFLAAFLVAICLFSLFDGLHRFCKLNCS